MNSYDEVVFYCPKCMSLDIRYDENDETYCNKCGSRDYDCSTLDKWEDMYIERYGEPLLTHTDSVTESVNEIFSEFDGNVIESDFYDNGIIINDVLNRKLR